MRRASGFGAKDYLAAMASRYAKDNITILASGMVYSTLIALVPCITFFAVFLGAFGVLDPFLRGLSGLLVDVFGRSSGRELSETITTLTMNAGTLGTFGIISFIVTFVLLINKFWTVVNRIYRTRLEKNFFKRLMTFLIALIVGTLLLVVFLGLKAKFSDWYAAFFKLDPLDPKQKILEGFSGSAVLWFIIFALMMTVPNTGVRGRCAAASSALVTVSVMVLDLVFASVSKLMVGYSVIYGSLGVVFIFLLWVFIFWVIILMGFESCFILQFRPRSGGQAASASPLAWITDVLSMMILIGDRYSKGEGAVMVEELERTLAVTNINLHKDIDLMEGAGLLLRTGPSGEGLIPARPLSRIGAGEIIRTLFGAGHDGQGEGARAVQVFKDGGLEALDGLSLEDLVNNSRFNAGFLAEASDDKD